MITLSILFILIGFLLCYSTSKRAKPAVDFRYIKRVFKQKKNANITGLLSILFGLTCSIIILGPGAGVFSFLVILMGIASLVILLTPLNYFSLRSVSILFLVSFIIEFLIQAYAGK